jgi:archaemetzincin
LSGSLTAGAGVPPIRAVRLAALGEIAAEVATHVVRETSRRLTVPCTLAEAGFTPRDDRDKIAGRDQWDADKLLAWVEERCADDRSVVVALTELDLAVPIFTFVFGRARHGGRAAVVSLARLRPTFHGEPHDASVLIRRAVAEILHELGHVAGLGHCRDASCLMHFSSTVETIDVRGGSFCPLCAAALPLAPTAAPSRFP